MLGKLLKHEFKNTSKFMLMMYAIVAAVTLLNVLSINLSSGESTSVFEGAMLILYTLTAIALFIVVSVYVCWHFYKTTYSAQGYLTHTLPVKPLAILNAKLLTSCVWMCGAILLLIVSVFVIILAATGGSLPTQAEWQYFLKDWEQTGIMPFTQFAVFMGIYAFISVLHFLLMVFAAASVGQLFSNNKLALSIVSGIVFYFAEQIISLIFMLAAGWRMFSVIVTTPAGSNVALPPDTMTPMLVGALILTTAFTVVYYIINTVILRKHVNLE